MSVSMTLDDQLVIGELLFRMGRDVIDDDRAFMQRLADLDPYLDRYPEEAFALARFLERSWPRSMFGPRPPSPVECLATAVAFARIIVSTADAQVVAIGSARWAQIAFPTVDVSHTFAASLMATTVARDVLQELRSPWPAFVITVPDGLLDAEVDASFREQHFARHGVDLGETTPVNRVIVMRHVNTARDGAQLRWAFSAQTLGGISLYRFGVSAEELLEAGGVVSPDASVDPFGMPLASRDERVMVMIGRLIIGVCLSMTDPARVKPIGGAHRQHEQAAKRNRRLDEPAARIFRVGQPVKHDLRPAVRQYLAGLRSPPSVQTVVAGHWKMQPHGPRMSLRKLQWIEPYVRGPEDAPFLVRPHKFHS